MNSNEISNTPEQVACLAEQIQQQFYELLPDWTKYEKCDYEILKHNIGYALFGPPTESIETTENVESLCLVKYVPNNIEDLNCISEAIQYSEKAMRVITSIFEQIINNSEQSDKCIYCGIIYNIIFNNGKWIKNSNKNTRMEINEKDNINEDIYAVPIFKIKKELEMNQTIHSRSIADISDTWYIDNDGRVYKSWKDYKENNKLPKCTMVLPKDGLYQPNREYLVTKLCSTVWVETLPSPACSISSTILNGLDNMSSLLNIGLVGITAASMFTPITPAVALVGATRGITGAWTVGRSLQYIVDRGIHKESISPTDRNVLPAWLSIAGSSAGLVASGGSMLLSKVAKQNLNVGLTAKLAYNSAVISTISINLVGLGYNGYRIYEKYQKENRVDLVDIFHFIAHAMFFGNAVISAKFADEIITNSQGNIMKEYEGSLHSERHLEAYKRVKHNSPTTEIVRYIKRIQTIIQLFAANENYKGFQNNFTYNVTFKNGKLRYKDITLLDPLVFINNMKDKKTSQFGNVLLVSTGHSNYIELSATFLNLLADHYIGYPQMVTREFQNIITEMQHVRNGNEILEKIFSIAIKLVKTCNLNPFLENVIRFLLEYAAGHLRKEVRFLSEFIPLIENNSISRNLIDILSHLHDLLDTISSNLITAIHKYININNCNKV